MQIVSTPPSSSKNEGLITIFCASRPCGPAGWLAMLLIKAVYVETNPGPTTTRTQVWIFFICLIQIQVRKQISLWCHRIENWVHLRCAAPNDTAYKWWSCHSGLKLLCKLCRTSPPPAMGARFTVFLGMPAMRTRWMAGAAAHKSG